MLLQQAAFTYHGGAEPLTSPVLAFCIPAKAKKQVAKELERIALTEPQLFPELDHLSKAIKRWR
jgi:hypothetical protein